MAPTLEKGVIIIQNSVSGSLDNYYGLTGTSIPDSIFIDNSLNKYGASYFNEAIYLYN